MKQGLLFRTKSVFLLQVFVNFAKEQTDDDQLREVTVNGGGSVAIRTNRPQRPTDLKLQKSSSFSNPRSPSAPSIDQATRSVQTPEPSFTGSKTKKSKSNSLSVSRPQQQVRMEPVGEAANGSNPHEDQTPGKKDPSTLFIISTKTQESKV